MTHQSQITCALRERQCLLAAFWLMLCALHGVTVSDGTLQVEAERTYVQKLERLGKLTVHPTPCAGHRSCDEVGAEKADHDL